MTRLVVRTTVLIGLTIGATPVAAQERVTEHTIKPAPGSKPPAATIADMAWLAGHWTGSALGGVSEEVWMPPSQGMMLGMYRLMVGDKPRFFELLTLGEENGSLMVRLKHFNPDMSGWEEKNVSVSFPLVAKSAGVMQFTGMTFQREGENRFTVYLAISQKDGTVREELFRYTRLSALGPPPK